jgi:hypothetical protein
VELLARRRRTKNGSVAVVGSIHMYLREDIR